MIRLGFGSLLAGLVLVNAFSSSSLADAKDEAPDFKEVFELVKSHVSGLSEEDLNRAAVQGLLSALGPKVWLVTNATSGKGAGAEARSLMASTVYDGEIAYLRVGRVDDGLPKAISDSCKQLSTNKLKGLVLDLRFAAGDDYAAAAGTADLFLKKERPLLNWGNGVVSSHEKEDAITLPIAILVNRQTAGAAEALAAALRETGAGLVLGSPTAGQAMIAQEFPLKNGAHLRIATAPVQLADGSSLSSSGLKPDIAVDVTSDEERAYYADSFIVLPKSDLVASANLTLANSAASTNRPIRRPRLNEAELVRERREGATRDLEATNARESELEKKIVHDPVLARALDLLKGLAVVRQSRS